MECVYCKSDDARKTLMVDVAQLNVSTLYFWKEQSYMGHCVLAYKDCEKRFVDLSPDEVASFMNDMRIAAQAVREVFHPTNINYGAFGDNHPHLHFHIVPKYQQGMSWGGTFDINAHKTYLSDAGYERLTNELRIALAEIVNK